MLSEREGEEGELRLVVDLAAYIDLGQHAVERAFNRPHALATIEKFNVASV